MTTQGSDKWWVRRWQSLLQQIGVDTGGNGHVRGCRVKRIEITPGQVQASVVDRETGAASVEIRVPTLSDRQWTTIIDALGSQAIFAAQLFAGNMPAEMEQVFADAGASLLPVDRTEIEQSCSTCPPDTLPCRPLIAVYNQLTELLAEDPWLLLRLRGRDRQQVIAAIHEKRNSSSGETPARTPAASNTPTAEMAGGFFRAVGSVAATDQHDQPLELRFTDFWGRRKVLEDIHLHLARPAVELALMRRLGPPTPSPDGMAAFDQLQAIYRSVSDMAWSLAFAPESDADAPADMNGVE